MRINEIFYSIQGEGRYAGLPTIFIRTQGCNLQCPYCDTGYAQMPAFGKELGVETVLIEALSTSLCRYVCITGGEPLTQGQEVGDLVRHLKRFFYNISIETNGTMNPPIWSNLVDSWCVDIKCPSAVPKVDFNRQWLNSRPCDQLKFVVSDDADVSFASHIIGKVARDGPEILISPRIHNADDVLGERLWLVKVAEVCKDLNVRMSLQVHKVIWGNKKGV